MGDAVGVVNRAVKWVDDPDAVAGIDRPAGPGTVCRRGPLAGTRVSRLLGQEGVVGEGLPDGGDDDLLGEVVDLGDHVLLALLDDLLEVLVALDLDARGGAGGGDGHR